MEWLNNLFNDWGPWVALVGGFAGIVGWAVGLPMILRIMATAADVLGPLLKAIVAVLVGLVSWVWATICWPAIQDICDNWRTLVFVLALAGSIVYFMDARMDIKMDGVVDQLSACQNEMTKLRRVKPAGSDWFLDWFLK